MDELKKIIAMRHDDKPVFGEPWQAEAFVLAVALSEAGHFSWAEWVSQFATLIKNYPQKPDESASNAYYRQWLQCLEKMINDHEVLKKADVLIREEKWRLAYLHTPHGSPVMLEVADDVNEHDEHHHHHHHHHDECGHHHAEQVIKPLCIFPAKSVMSRKVY